MSSTLAKTLINQIIKKTKYNNVIKFEDKCTKIYIFSSNMDDDKLIEKSIINQYCNSNSSSINTQNKNEILNKNNIENNNCCKFKCCKIGDN